MIEFLQKAKEAKNALLQLNPAQKNSILNAMAKALRENTHAIIEANQKDLQTAKQMELSQALVDRLLLNEARIDDMATALEEIAALKEPIGRVLDGWILDNGLKVEKSSIPIGVISVIYESRPNVTSDTAGLCFKSSNVVILKGGKEAEHSNKIIASTLQRVLEHFELPKEIISLLPDSSREGVAKLIKMDDYVDLVIPRGGEGLIRFIVQNATVPMVKHDKGLCHTYVAGDANIDSAIAIALNAKTQRTGVCNAMETLLVDKAIADTILPLFYDAFSKAGTELRGCEKTQVLIKAKEASDEDFHTEYLANILSIKIVENIDEAIAHIGKYGSGHSEAIVTNSAKLGEKFLNEVDAACVYLNASTRFTDGGAFGFGAEVGISTNKLHARGPMGINDLTTYKYKVYGEGQIR